MVINRYLLIAFLWKTMACQVQDQKETLQVHNVFRKRHLSKPLQLSQEMSKEAAKYALELAKEGMLRKSNSSDGENLAFSCEKNSDSSKKASEKWYNELCQQGYDFFSENDKYKVPHFTQLVWKNTKYLGIGSHTFTNHDGKKCTYIVARYRPAGNLKNMFKVNVKKGSFNAKKMCHSFNNVDVRSHVKFSEDGLAYVNSKVEKKLQQSKISDIAKTIAKALALGAKVGAIAGAKAGAKVGKKIQVGSIKNNTTFYTTKEMASMNNAAHVSAPANHYYFDDSQNDNLEGLPSIFSNKFSKENITQLFNSVFDAAADAAEKAGEIAGRKAALNVNLKHYTKKKLNKPSNLFTTVSKLQQTDFNKSESSIKNTAEYSSVNKKVEKENFVDSLYTQDEYKTNVEDTSKLSPKNEDKSIQFDQDGLKAHNIFRKIHNAPDMKLNAKMSKEAEKYAKYLASIQDLKHSTDRNGEGENLAYGCNSVGTEMSAAEAVKNWYSEVCSPGHDFSKDGGSGTGHFTQVVWKGSTELGMGKATSKKDGMLCTYIVGRYKPAGNMLTQFTKNVFKGSFDKKKTCDNLDNVLSSAAQDTASDQSNPSASNSPAVIPVTDEKSESKESDKNQNSFDQEGLKAHNILRKIHDAPEMKLNPKLSEEAEKYAKHLADIKELQHSTDRKDEGENLAYGCNSAGTEMSAAEAVKNWYSEVCSPGHDFSKDGGSATGHFTQVVWKGSTELGMGKATSKKDGMLCTYIVGRYKPAGNMLTQFTKNVFKGSFYKEKTCDSLDNLLSSAGQDTASDQSNPSASNSPAVIPVTDEKSESKESDKNQNSFDQEGLKAHNILRKIHDAPEMKLNPKLSEEAEKYAKHLADIKELQHSTDRKDEGENLAYGCNSAGTEMSAAEAVKNWYSEVCSPGHDFDKDGGSATGHFTQVVWKGSTELGMGKATSKKDGMLCTYIVGRYKPAGNMLTQFTKNVFKGSFDKKKTCDSLDNLLSSAGQDTASDQSNPSASNSPAVIPVTDEKSESKESDKNQNSFDQEGLKAHNILRKIHDAPEMKLNPKLSEEAEKYAKHLADIKELQHSTDRKDEGENLAYGCNSAGTEMSAAEAVKNWYSEVCSPGHDFNKDGGSATGHFTQVVWKDSTELGMGKSTSKKDGMLCTYIVGRYKPAGNMLTQFTKNVLIGSFNKESTCDSLDNLLISATGSNDSNQDNSTSPNSSSNSSSNSPTSPNSPNSSIPTVGPCAGVCPGVKESSVDKDFFVQMGLNTHNIFRKIHSVPNMALSKQMSDEAEAYAKYLASIQTLRHSTGLIDEGENLAYGCNSGETEMTAAEAVKNWYSEVCKPGYSFEQNSGAGTGHFTQVVWKTSTQLGIGKSVSKKDGMLCTYIVARYKLAGNVLGEFNNNVLQGSFDSKETCKNLDNLISDVFKDSNLNSKKPSSPPNPAESQSIGQTNNDSKDENGNFLNEKETLKQAMTAAIEAAVNAAYDVGKKIAESLKGGKEVTPNPKEALNAALSNNKRQIIRSHTQIAEKRTASNFDRHDDEQSDFVNNPEKVGAILGAKAGAKAGAMAAANFIEQEVKKKLKSSFGFLVKNGAFMPTKSKNMQSQELSWNTDLKENSPKYSKASALVEVDTTDSKQEKLITQEQYKDKENALKMPNDCTKKANATGNTAECIPKDTSKESSADSASVESAAKIGALVGAKAGAEAAVMSVQRKDTNATKYNLSDKDNSEKNTAKIQGQMWNVHLDEETKTAENLNSDLCSKRSGDNSTSENDLVWKCALEGAQIGAEKGAVAAADEVIRAVGVRGLDKLIEKKKARRIGQSVAENEAVVIAKQLVQDIGLKLPELKTCDASQKSDFHEVFDYSPFARSGLAAHNQLRRIHGVPDLKLDPEMTKKAEEYAEKLSRQGKSNLVTASPSEREGCGENLAVYCRSPTSQVVDEAAEAVGSWHSEVCTPGYSFNDDIPPISVLHFTQVVWKSTTLLGMGRFTTKMSDEVCTYIVARYKEAGNVAGLYKTNVVKGDFSQNACLLMKNSSFVSGPVITEDDTVFILEALDAHNSYRAVHHSQPLIIDDKLAADAQNYAENIAKRGVLEHEINIDDGENLAMKCLGPQEAEPSGVFFTTLWYQEVCNPNYKFNEVFDPTSAHFTQVVWGDTKFLGIGRAQTTKDGITCQYIVARYRPAGNFVEEFRRNVLKGSFSGNVCKGLSDKDKRHLTPRYKIKSSKEPVTIDALII